MSKKSITLRWPPTKLQFAKGLLWFYLIAFNLILLPLGLIAGDGSGLRELALSVAIVEVIGSMIWAVMVVDTGE